MLHAQTQKETVNCKVLKRLSKDTMICQWHVLLPLAQPSTLTA